MKIKSIFITLLLCFLSFGAGGGAVAKQAKNVEIAITTKASNESSEIAKNTAIHDGKRQAFYEALNKLSPSNARNIYRNLVAIKQGKGDLDEYLQSYTINREVVKKGFYEADIIYRFDAKKLSSITGVGEQTNDDAEPTGDGLLILPIHDVGANLLLFERGNQWRYALNESALEAGQGKLVMPFGDVRDQNMANAQSVLAGDKTILAGIARRYGTRNVVIALAKNENASNENASLRVILRRAGESRDNVADMNFTAQEGETTESLLERAAEATAVKLRQSIGEYSLFGASEANKLKAIVVRAEFTSGKQWRYMLEAMRGLPNLERLDLGAVGLQSAQATLLHKGDASVIKAKMVERGLIIDDSGEYWVVRVPASLVR